MKTFATIVLSTLALSLWPPVFTQAASPAVQTLRGSDAAAADQAPEEKSFGSGAPGGSKRGARTFGEQPPVIPHAIEDSETVSLEQNTCLACHGPDTYKAVKAPKVADSHFIGQDGKKLKTVAPARQVCTSCHVPQADAKPLVENTFRAGTATDGKKKR